MITDWQAFLTEQGATFSDRGEITVATQKSALEYLTKNCIYDLSHQGLVQVTGPDTDKFLQGQLTCDLSAITLNQSQLGACCTPKGRMVTNFNAIRTAEDQIALVMDKNIVEDTKAHLSKYAVFFKSELTNASESWVRIGISGPDSRQTLSTIFDELPTKPGNKVNHTHGFILQVSASAIGAGSKSANQSERFEIWFSDQQTAQEFWGKASTNFEFVDHNTSRLLNISAGLGWVECNTQELFIPQMLNLQAINGISFTKGCYTGQEIVARMQYRGTLKRRMYVADVTTSSPLNSGDECFCSYRESQIGHIVNVCRLNKEQYKVLVVLENEAVKKNDTLLFQQDGPHLQIQNLPYTIELENKEE